MSVKVRRTRVPRASIAVTIMQDLDCVSLCQSGAGREAIALFFMLIAEAKAQRNGGRFAAKDQAIAALVHWPLRDFRRAVKRLAEIERPWVVREGDSLIIRNFQVWNSDPDGWGGVRAGAGRPPSRNQEEIKMNNQDDSKGCASVSDTLTSPPPSTSNEMSGDNAPLPADGGGGDSLRGESGNAMQGAPPPATPAEPPDEAEAQAGSGVVGRIGPAVNAKTQASTSPSLGPATLATATAAVDHAEQHRRESAEKAMAVAGILDPGTRSRISAYPTVTASLVRKVRSDHPGIGGGALANAIDSAARAIVWREQQQAEPAADGAERAVSPQLERSRREAEEYRQAQRMSQIDAAMTLLAIDALPIEVAERAKHEVLDANRLPPSWRMSEPRTVSMLRHLIIKHLDIDVEPYRAEAEKQLTTESRSTQREAACHEQGRMVAR